MRLNPLEGRRTAAPGVAITPLPPSARLSLRLRPKSVAAAGRILGVRLPVEPLRSATNGTRSALWLGPDEWLLVDDASPIVTDGLSKLKAPFSAVDVSHRNTTLEILGPAAASVLAAGCPLDLALPAFPVGKCTRTVLGKVEIVLWRTGETAFRVDCWRSFADYVFAFMEEAARDAMT
jgi:sarcosine oxidase subunit gamma